MTDGERAATLYKPKWVALYRFLILLIIAALLTACAGARPNIEIPTEQPPPLVLKKQPRVALVLGAGGARGFAHAGVVKVLQNAGVPIDLIVGSSVGSFYGALLADTGDANLASKIMLSATFWDVADIGNTPSLTGAITGYRYQKFLLQHMRAKWFNQLKIPLVASTTDLRTGKLFVISSGPIAPAAEASSSIPGFVRPAYMYGHILIDGGIVDPIPVDIAKRYHPKIIIAVNIGQQLSNHLPRTALGIMGRGFQISWHTLSHYSTKGADIVIHPHVGESGTFDVSKKYELFYEGEVAAKKALPTIRKLLAENHIPLNKTGTKH